MIGHIKPLNTKKIGRKFSKLGKQIGRKAKRGAQIYHIANRDFIQAAAPVVASTLPGPYGAAVLVGAAAADGLDRGISTARTVGAASVKHLNKTHSEGPAPRPAAVQFAGAGPTPMPRTPFALRR